MAAAVAGSSSGAAADSALGGQRTGGRTGSGASSAAKGQAMGKPESRNDGMFIDAWADPMAGLSGFNSNLALSDVSTDGDSKLIVADMKRRLIVYKGTNIIHESPLLALPAGVEAFQMEVGSRMTPMIAVAAGCHVYLHCNLRPGHRFTVPAGEIADAEAEAWADAASGMLDVSGLVAALQDAHDNRVSLTERSLDLLMMHSEKERDSFVRSVAAEPLTRIRPITCTTVLPWESEDTDGSSVLVLGIEDGRVLVLDRRAAKVNVSVRVPSAPVFLAPSGMANIEYRVAIACRNQTVYMLKNGELTGTKICLDAQPVGLLRREKSIIIGTANRRISSFHLRGKKQWSMYVPASITCMQRLNSRSRGLELQLVALDNNELRVYQERTLLYTMTCDAGVTGMRFGKMGREEDALIVLHRTGQLTVKMLPRTFKVDTRSSHPGPPAEQDIPLNVPTKTRLYVEQCSRERNNGRDMHLAFQRDLFRLRVTTAREFLKTVTRADAPISNQDNVSVRMSCSVQGIGPLFRVGVVLTNTGHDMLAGLRVVLTCNPRMYCVRTSTLPVPTMLPGIPYSMDAFVDIADGLQAGSRDSIKVLVMRRDAIVPLITGTIEMPVAETDLFD